MLMGRGEHVTQRDVAAFVGGLAAECVAEDTDEKTVTDPTIVSGHAPTCPMVYKMSA